ncbi:uncharacterized protein [Anabrus simplex]|uniref:uncharacterized protein isoform X2 n=1 Tax=Anabrus simplex TaxID=316456 RepID=UPI0035A35791
MSSHTDENGVKYVLTLSQPNKKVCLKKVNIKDIPPSALGRVIRCKQISSMQLSQEPKVKSDEVELTVVPGSAGTDPLTDKDASIEVAAKKIKIENVSQSDEEDDTSKAFFQADGYGNEDDEFDDDDDDGGYNEHVYSSSEKQIKNNPRMSLKQDDYDYIPPGSYKARRSGAETEKRKVKPKLFRAEWLNIDIFRDWLDRDPTNPYKARCIACDSVINAGKSELEKHAAGMKHAQALERMQQMMVTQLEESNEDTQHTDGSQEPNSTQNVMFGEDLQSELYHIRLQQVDALNRVATAIETLSATAVGVLEKMASTQENLVQIIQELQKK